eukprot:CAMPEP_0206492992 /NCGR_PEP_ID=MMETSP0324_2-20121206/46575_1 /ASSEMBLY_ACC=CAM_ASM_000836 /TAXON_ID=2866 /ORGANISM="Crypthecodinium cohnii, Strain Seligo" /LENGTH=82 /DNA_ID=CAMNT_0053975787 /DNA_START=76 /DNA_END=324 /DNA_ORIENTATION=-
MVAGATLGSTDQDLADVHHNTQRSRVNRIHLPLDPHFGQGDFTQKQSNIYKSRTMHCSGMHRTLALHEAWSSPMNESSARDQ